MDLVSLVLLLITGIIALVMTIFLFKDYAANKKLYHMWWGLSSLILFLAGVLIVAFDFAVLGNPAIPIVATFIPVGLAIGLLYAVWDDKPYGLYYTIYGILMVIIQIVARYVPIESVATPSLLAAHIPSGLIIVLVPLMTTIRKETEASAILFSLGGIAISLGGMLLAALKFDAPILPAATIFAVLPLLLLIVSVLFFLGIFLPTKWKAGLPVG